MNPIIKIFNASGVLQGSSVEVLKQEVSYELRNGAEIILLDFQNVELLKGCGLNHLIAIRNEVISQNGELIICSLNDRVKIVFEISRMDSIFKLFADRNECENYIKLRAASKYELVLA